MATMQPNDTITVAEAYEAMRTFLETVWRRLDKPQEEIAFLLGGLKWADGSPVDSTLWQDWLAAAQRVKEQAANPHSLSGAVCTRSNGANLQESDR
jgi:hypothetical protein